MCTINNRSSSSIFLRSILIQYIIKHMANKKKTEAKGQTASYRHLKEASSSNAYIKKRHKHQFSNSSSCLQNLLTEYGWKLTGSLLKKTNDVRVKINHLFFHDVHPIPAFTPNEMLQKRFSI